VIGRIFRKANVMTEAIHLHPVHKAINKPLTVWGAERRLFFLALVIGGATFNFFASLTGGLAIFLALFLFARWATVTDSQILRVLFNSAKFRVSYDPMKFEGIPRRGKS
jgi:type IV secretory pathway TrbD component